MDFLLFAKNEKHELRGGGFSKTLRNFLGGLHQILTFPDKGREGGQKTPKIALRNL